MNHHLTRSLILGLSLSLSTLFAHAEAMPPGTPSPLGTTIDLQAEASQPAPNDLVMASVYYEATDGQAAELARKVNAAVDKALKTAGTYPSIKTRSGGTYTYPVYGAKGDRIDAWRMRSEILLESQDLTALSELLGKLQDGMAISGISFMPSPATRHRASDQAAVDAIAAFNAKAKILAAALGKNYRIVHLNVGTSGGPELRPMVAAMKAPSIRASVAPLPAEAGESTIAVAVSGTIELKD